MKTIIKFKEKFNKLSKQKKIIAIGMIIFICFICVILGIKTKNRIIENIEIKKLESDQLLQYDIKQMIDEDNYNILVKIYNENGLETVKYKDYKTNEDIVLNCNNKRIVAIDWKAKDLTDYEFKIKINGQNEKTEILHYEVPRIQGNYNLVKGIYVNEPDISKFNKSYTRYVSFNEDGEAVPENYIDREKPQNWYDYNNSKWANIYIENNSLETYLVWIPRYCYKLDYETQRSDVKFIDVYNNYKDENGNIITWAELKQQGYHVPEAFFFGGRQISGYWATKYKFGERDIYTIDYETVASKTKIKINGITTNTDEEIAKYYYYIDGEKVNTSTEPDDYVANIQEEREYIVTVTIVGAKNGIIGSMTKKVKPVKVNQPDLSKFDQETTFYVIFDNEGYEYNTTIPINREAPNDWYDYADSKWANIVTRNNGLETYYVWIPRYEYKLNQTSQRSYINFIEGTSTEVTTGYKIPEAFKFNGKELTGYWATKYKFGNETMGSGYNTEVTATSNSIKTKGIIGGEEGEKYKYYINGEYKGQKSNADDEFTFSNLNENTKYTVLVDVLDENGKHKTAILKQIKTIGPNTPDLSKFNKNTTYYVTYDNDGNETSNRPISQPPPNNWYDYSNRKWANIVTRNNGLETYFVWIPRYEYKIETPQEANTASARTEVRFLKDITTDKDEGYKIPEAFTFNGKELTGYWATKYVLGE